MRGGGLPVSAMIVVEDPIGPIFRHQHEAAPNNSESARELVLQATQADRRVEAPRSEVVRVDHDLQHYGRELPDPCAARQIGHGQSPRRYVKA